MPRNGTPTVDIGAAAVMLTTVNSTAPSDLRHNWRFGNAATFQKEVYGTYGVRTGR